MEILKSTQFPNTVPLPPKVKKALTGLVKIFIVLFMK